MSPTPTREQLQKLEAVIVERSSRSLQDFLDCLIVEASPAPKRFSLIRDDWQQDEILTPLVPAIEHAAGVRPDYDGVQWFQFFMPRGHSKTSVQAMLVIWALVFSKSYCAVTCAAADKAQADELRKAIQVIQRLNWWLKDRIEVQRDGVKGPKGDLEIISSDAASSYGKRRHIYICDEFTVWGENNELFDSLYSGADKIKEAAFIITSNAGFRGSWQERVKDQGLSDPDHWYVFEAPGHLASWMSEDTREAKRILMLPGEARRVLDNVWVNPNEVGDFVTEHEVNACLALAREMGLAYLYRAMIGVRYVASIDYGPKKDRTVCTIMHRDEETDLHIVDQMRIWRGVDFENGTVPIQVVEDWIDESCENFHLRLLIVDKYQMESTIQKYESRLPVERFEPRGGKANYEMAILLRKMIIARKLLWYEEAGILKIGNVWETFADELLSVQLRPMAYGFRIDNLVAGTHDDRVVSVGMALLALNSVPRSTNLAMATVQRNRADRNIMGVPRQDVTPQQRLYQQLHRTVPPKAPSAADRRGLYGRGKNRG